MELLLAAWVNEAGVPKWGQLWRDETFVWDTTTTPLAHPKLVVAVVVAYWITIYGLGKFMQDKEPYKLQNVTALHNLILCGWSAGMFFALVYAILHQYYRFGTRALFCAETEEQADEFMHYCLYVFYVSKFYELLDTVILRLKKRPLIFLHWYHHSVVLAMTWSWLHYSINFACLGMLANCLVHIFMYYYYFCSSIGIRDIWWKRYITSMQLVQFAASFVLSVGFKAYSLDGRNCIGSELGPFEFTLCVNISFFVLFLQFYRTNYKSSKKTADQKKD